MFRLSPPKKKYPFLDSSAVISSLLNPRADSHMSKSCSSRSEVGFDGDREALGNSDVSARPPDSALAPMVAVTMLGIEKLSLAGLASFEKGSLKER